MELSKFLVKAKIATYASEGEGGEKDLEDGSKELTYEEEEFRYRDRYFGFNPFSGEEVVWKNNEFIWVMNYYGKVVSDKIPAKQIYEFLGIDECYPDELIGKKFNVGAKSRIQFITNLIYRDHVLKKIYKSLVSETIRQSISHSVFRRIRNFNLSPYSYPPLPFN